jgi:hypothetical protein
MWVVVPGAGFEPARPKPGDFKSPAFTISPPGPILQSIPSNAVLPRPRPRADPQVESTSAGGDSDTLIPSGSAPQIDDLGKIGMRHEGFSQLELDAPREFVAVAIVEVGRDFHMRQHRK